MESQYSSIKHSTDYGFLRINYLNISGKLSNTFSGKIGQHPPLLFNISCFLEL